MFSDSWHFVAYSFKIWIHYDYLCHVKEEREKQESTVRMWGRLSAEFGEDFAASLAPEKLQYLIARKTLEICLVGL